MQKLLLNKKGRITPGQIVLGLVILYLLSPTFEGFVDNMAKDIRGITPSIEGSDGATTISDSEVVSSQNSPGIAIPTSFQQNCREFIEIVIDTDNIDELEFFYKNQIKKIYQPKKKDIFLIDSKKDYPITIYRRDGYTYEYYIDGCEYTQYQYSLSIGDKGITLTPTKIIEATTINTGNIDNTLSLTRMSI